MAKKLEGKVAVVTGASKGIGASIALHLAAEGASVVVNYSSSKEGADRIVGEINGNGGRAIAVQGSVAKEGDVRRLFAETKKAFGRLDVLVNNAGVYEFKPLEAVKLFGDRGGSIINISSVAASSAPPTGSLYSGTKAAVDAVTRSLAQELGSKKIRVNSLNPGMVETEGFRAAGIGESDFRKQVEAQTPLGRIGQPKDIAPVAVFLASDDSAWITGETIYVAGGLR